MSSTTTALPLKVSPAIPSKSPESLSDKTPVATKPSWTQTTGSNVKVDVESISSPQELTAFVESLLEQLDSKFDEMSSQILDRMTQMATRVDTLESSIQDIISGDGPSQSPPI
ncbi:hypothetical protein L218DRAFT_852040 [Marasmius fiardii PR-910]|nr:hypothetical protein L218DRAFT_852040 [Marasmius fiardii PR-910]